MAVRSSMSEIIPRVRQLVGDPASSIQDFTDQDVQDVCDAFRQDVTRELLTVDYDIQPPQGTSNAALVIWCRAYSKWEHWEANEVLQGINVATGKSWNVLGPIVSERINGRWTFEVELPNIAVTIGQYPPIFLTGRCYDIYTIAASLLERRIAMKAFTQFNVTASGTTMALGSILDRLEQLRLMYLERGWTHVVTIARTDLAAERGSRPGYGVSTDSQAGLLPGVISPSIVGPAG